MIGLTSMYQIIRLQLNSTRKVYTGNFPILIFLWYLLNISTIFISFISYGSTAQILGPQKDAFSYIVKWIY